MRKTLFILLLLSAATLAAQQHTAIEGRIVNEEGEGVEYATIGIPGTEHGTLSGTDGYFTLTLPQECNDTLVITHVSYCNKKLAVATSTVKPEPLTITLQPRELKEVVVYSGKRRKAKLMNRGMRVAGAVTQWSASNIGDEIGTVVSTRRVFEAQEIRFNVLSNTIGNARLSVNIYSTQVADSTFSNIMHNPVYVDIPASDKKRECSIELPESIFLEPGEYYISLKFVDVESSKPQNGKLQFPLYLKSSYKRAGVMEELERIPVNMGLQVKGHIM